MWTGLKALEFIGGKFTLDNLSAVENLDGLKALSYVGGDFWMYRLPLITRLNGFSSLKEVRGTLTIYSVPFESFSDFSSLKRVPKNWLSKIMMP